VEGGCLRARAFPDNIGASTDAGQRPLPRWRCLRRPFGDWAGEHGLGGGPDSQPAAYGPSNQQRWSTKRPMPTGAMPHRQTILMNRAIWPSGLSATQRVSCRAKPACLPTSRSIPREIREGAALMFYPEVNAHPTKVDCRSATPAFNGCRCWCARFFPPAG